MGNKVLRQRLKGPAVAAYYPRKAATIKDLKTEFGPHLTTWDEAEEDRFEYIQEYVLGTQTLGGGHADRLFLDSSCAERALQRRRVAHQVRSIDCISGQR